MQDLIFPLIVPLPILIGDPVCRIPLDYAVKVFEIGGHLRALVSGTLTATIKNFTTGIAISSALSWSASGMQNVRGLNAIIGKNEDLAIAVSGIGIGALDCFVTIWCQLPGI